MNKPSNALVVFLHAEDYESKSRVSLHSTRNLPILLKGGMT
jgi:hypothetical protein